MKALVTYFSQTGNTKLIAEAIYEVLSNHIHTEIGTVRSIDMDSLATYNLLMVGGPCHDSDLVQTVKGFLNRLPKAPKFRLAGFFTHATNMPDSERNRQLFDQWAGRCQPSFEKACEAKNIDFLGIFHCQGKASAPIEHFIHQEIITDEDEWNQYLQDLRKHPTAYDVENAKKYALEILEKL